MLEELWYGAYSDGQETCAVRTGHVLDISICSFHFDCPRNRAGKLSLGSLDPFTLQFFEVPMGSAVKHVKQVEHQ